MRRDLWEVGGRVFVGIRLAKGQGEREAAATGVLELAVLPRGQGAGPCTLQDLVTAFGLS